MQDIKNTDKYLKDHGIKPSFQRIQIFDYLLKSRNHPTVDKIYKELIGLIPTLSKTTVYNTLKLFNEKGIVLIINIEDKEARFDADVSNHGHFKCKICNEIYDFRLSENDIFASLLKDFDIEEQHVYLKGVCVNCK